MKRKIWSVILTVCMVLGMMPAMSVPVAATASPLIEVAHDGMNFTTYSNFAVGWNNAVGDNNTSNTKVKLLHDWTAYTDNTYGTSFGTGIGFGDGTASGAGFILVPKGKTITLDLNGHMIDRGLTAAQANGEVICIDSSSLNNTVFTLADSDGESPSGEGNGTTGCITGGYNSGNGGGIYLVGDNVDCTIKGGCISGNKASGNGGGIYTENVITSGDLTITGGKITGNSAANGGGIYCTMCCSGITDCTVQGNTATTYGGGIYSAYRFIGMGGTTVVSGNAHGVNANPSTASDATPGSGGATDNLYLAIGSGLPTSTTVTCNALKSGASIGVTTQTPPTAVSPVDVTSGSTADYSEYFHSDNNSYYIYNDASDTNDQIVKLGYGVIEVAYDGTNFITYGDFAAGWNYAVGDYNTLNTKVRLLADWTADTDNTYGTSFGTGSGFGDGNVATSNAGYILVPRSKYIKLDLNGHNIDRKLTSPQGSTRENGGWVLKNVGTLIIKDGSTATVEHQGEITGGYDGFISSSAGGIFNSNTLTLQGGRITGNKAVNWGGGVRNNGTFTMTGGEISGNIANYDNNNDGGAGGVYNGNSFTMTGGEISGNYTCDDTHGGGVYNEGTVTFEVGGTAKITGNVSGATFSSTNGTASGGVTDNVYLKKAVIICLANTDALITGASIGVTTDTAPTAIKPVAVTGTNTGDLSSYFTSDKSAYGIYNDNKIVKLGAMPTYAVTYSGNGNTGGSVPGVAYYTSGTSVTVSGNTGGLMKTGYTFDGWNTETDGQGTTYAADDTFKIANSVTLYAKWEELQKVAEPVFSPAAGTYTSAQDVTLSSSPSDAAIYYTTDGTVPTFASTRYTGSIPVAATATIKAKAFKTGMTDSDTAQASYTINIPAGHTVTASASNASYGTVSGGGSYAAGIAVTVTATPNSGYHFVEWTENGRSVSPDASYTFTVTANRALTAVFEQDTETFIPVTGIEDVPENTVAGRKLLLHGSVLPENATHRDLTWKVINAGGTGAKIENGTTLTTDASGTVTVEATVKNGLSETTDYIQTFSISVSASSTLLFDELQEDSELTVGQEVIYATPSGASGSNAEMDYFLNDVVDMDASASDADFRDRIRAGTTYTIRACTDAIRKIVFTIWHVFKIEENSADSSRYVFLMHNPVWSVAFDGNGGSSSVSAMYTDENGYLKTLPSAARNGFTFTGWYTGVSGGEQVTVSTLFERNDTVYAHWTTAGGNTGSGSGGGISYTGQWIKNDIGWWYRNANGTWPANTWKQINGKWYHFDGNGYMQTGWILDNGKWYYLDGDGAMVTGLFHAPDGYWYYFWADGSMAVGDVTVDGKQKHYNDQLPPNPTYDKDPDTGIWYPNGNTDLPYGAGTE